MYILFEFEAFQKRLEVPRQEHWSTKGLHEEPPQEALQIQTVDSQLIAR